MTQRVVIHWGLSSLHGWGVYGLNLALAWAGDASLEAATDYEVNRQVITLDPLQWHALAGFRTRSAKLRAQLLRQSAEPITLNAVLLAALGNDLQPQPMPRCFPIAAKAAAILSRWKPWPAVCPQSLAPIPAILICSRTARRWR
jgi:hypothetical protein